MAEITRKRTGELLRKLFEILKAHPEGIQAGAALEQLAGAVTLTEYEAGTYESGGVRRFDKIVRFATVDCVKAGWLLKHKGTWSLTEKEIGKDQLAEMQKIIGAEKSDLFDVLAYVAYALAPLTREERATMAKTAIGSHFEARQRAFLSFVLSHYVAVGVDELDQEKLTPLLRLKYHNSIADAVADLGEPEEISKAFAGFQRFLYQKAA